LLVIARETTAATAQRTMASENGIRLLPPSPPIDSIVRAAPNIVYGIVSFEFDPGGVAREYDVAACAITPEGRAALPSAVSAAEAANTTRDAASAKTELRRRLGPLQAACVAGNLAHLPRPSPIGYHLAVGPDHERALSEGERMGAAPVHRNWRQADVCGQGRPSAQWIPADELLGARPQTEARALADFVCGAIVVIGGSTSLQPDVHLSPYGLMDGAMILANAARGRLIAAEMPAPLGRAFHILFQIVSVMLTVWLIHLAFKWIAWMRARLERNRGRHEGGALTFWRLGRVATHPIALGWLAPICIFFAGAAFTVMTLQFGLWSTLSVPAFSAALAETMIEWDAEMEA
jgi:hypothetical protein